MKRWIAAIMTLALCLGMLPGTAWAVETRDDASQQPRAASINMDYNGFVFAQGVPIAIKQNGSITSIYDSDGNLLSGDTDVSSCAIYGGWFDNGNNHTASTSIVMESGTVPVIYGGSYSDVLDGNTNITLNGGTVGWVYGGGNQSTVTGTTKVTVNSGVKVWGQKIYGDSAARGSVFGGGQGGSVTNTEVIYNGGDAQWIYGGGDYAYDGNGSPIGGCICTNTCVKFMGQPVDFINVFGGGNGGSAEEAIVEFHGIGYSPQNDTVNVFGGGWGDTVEKVQIIVGKNSTPSAVKFKAKCGESPNASVGTASFNVSMDLERPSMMNSSGLDGTGVTGTVSAYIHSDASKDGFIYTELTEIDELTLEGVSFTFTYGPSNISFDRLEVKESGSVAFPAKQGVTLALKELAGSGRVCFEKPYSGGGTITPITVDKITVDENARIKVDYFGGMSEDNWKDAVLFTGPGVEALQSVDCLTAVNDTYMLVKEDNNIKVAENTGAKQAYLDPAPRFDRDDKTYRYGETIQVTMGLKCQGNPLAGQTVSVEGGASGVQVFATGVTDENGMATISVPVNDSVWNSRNSALSGYFAGTEEYKANRYGVSGENGSMDYTIQPAQVSLSGEITAPARGGVPVKTLTVGGDNICTAEVLWSPADAAFQPEVAYTASIRLIPKPGYSLDGGRLGSVTYQGEALTLPASAEADGSILISNVKTFEPIPVIHVTGITLNQTSLSLELEKTAQLTATIAPSDADDKDVRWTSSAPDVATVDASGMVTAVSEGSATITATTQDGGKTAVCTVTVSGLTVPVTGVTLNKTSTSLTVGGSEQLTASVAPSDATNKTVTWASSAPAIATVDASGKVTAVSAGSAAITVTTADGGKTAVCTVTVSSGSGGNSGGSSGGGTTTPSAPVNTTTPSGGSGSETTASPSASTKGDTASSTVSNAVAGEIIKQAEENKSETVIIAPVVQGDVNKTEVTVPASALGELGSKTDASVTISTPVAQVSIPNSGLGQLASGGGTVTVSAEKVGNRVELSVTAGGSAVTDLPGGVTLTVPHDDCKPGTVAVLVKEDGTREVIRKSAADDGELTVTIPLNGSAKLEIVDNSKTFQDVQPTDWCADAAAFASGHDLFQGTGADTFSPNVPMTRGMLATVLHNLENNPRHDVSAAFSDLSGAEWYAPGVSWAAAQGIVTGYENGTFGGNDPITREQLAVMLWRYAGKPASGGGSLAFPDAGQAGDYALEALRWAVETGVLRGNADGTLNPKGQATRAQAAQMLMNFLLK